MWQQLLEKIRLHETGAIARAISLIENEYEGYQEFLSDLQPNLHIPLIGITGPPGAGKSTLVDGLIEKIVAHNQKVAVLCVDPSSPFHHGAVLGDRIRMSQWYTHPSIFIRSLASRGSLGGLHPSIIEISDLLRSAGFDYVLIETVGVGQSEVEIVGLADLTVVVVVPEAGDEIQTMKAGLMEIADVFVVNKADRPDADSFVKNLRLMLAPAFTNHGKEVPILKTVATKGEGVEALYEFISRPSSHTDNTNKTWLLSERLFLLIQKERMKDVDRAGLQREVAESLRNNRFNLYQMLKSYLNDSSANTFSS